MTETRKRPRLSARNSAHMNVLRALATLAVVAEHLLLLGFVDIHGAHGPLAWFVGRCSRAASEAVMIFFVLSGFFIASIVLRSIKTFSWTHYLTDRFCRLYLVLIPALLFTALVDLITRHTAGAATYLDSALPPLLDAPIAPHHTLAIFFSNLAFLQTITVPAFGSDLPLWTLSAEFWYYLAFPLACLALFAGSRLHKLVYAAALLLWLVLFPHKMVRYFLIWLLGVLIFLCPSLQLGRATRQVGLWLSAAAGAAVLFLPQAQALSVWTTDLLFSVAFSLWLLLLVRTEGTDQAPQPTYQRAGAWLAGCSYSIYLTHFPLLLLLRSWRAGQSWQLTPIHTACAALIILALVLFGWAFSLATEAHTHTVRTLLHRWTSALFARRARASAPEATSLTQVSQEAT